MKNFLTESANLSELSKDDDITYWLAKPNDETQRPRQYKKCVSRSRCAIVLKTFYSKKEVKVSVLSGTYIGIDFNSWSKLCELCRRSVWNWYFGQVFPTDPKNRPSIKIFSLQIETDNIAINWDMWNQELQRIKADYRNGVPMYAVEDLEDAKRTVKAFEIDYQKAHERLQSALKKQNKSKGLKTKSRSEIKSKLPGACYDRF